MVRKGLGFRVLGLVRKGLGFRVLGLVSLCLLPQLSNAPVCYLEASTCQVVCVNTSCSVEAEEGEIPCTVFQFFPFKGHYCDSACAAVGKQALSAVARSGRCRICWSMLK